MVGRETRYPFSGWGSGVGDNVLEFWGGRANSLGVGSCGGEGVVVVVGSTREVALVVLEIILVRVLEWKWGRRLKTVDRASKVVEERGGGSTRLREILREPGSRRTRRIIHHSISVSITDCPSVRNLLVVPSSYKVVLREVENEAEENDKG